MEYHQKGYSKVGGKVKGASRSVLEIGFCPNVDMGVAISDFCQLLKLGMPAKYLWYDVF